METKLISFASLKGGVGKSTHAVALTAGLLDQGHTVRFIETDEQGSAGAWADEVAAIDGKLQSSYLSIEGSDFQQANDKLLELSEGPEFVVVDTAGAANAGTLAALFTADLVVSPFTLTEWDMDGLKRTLTMFKRVFEQLNEDVPDSFLGLFVSEASFMSNVDRERLAALSDEMFIRKGMTKNANIKKWSEACRTPGQLREGIDRVEGSQPLNDASLTKVEKFISEYTKTIMEMF